jgi:toxin ParE1/3/4
MKNFNLTRKAVEDLSEIWNYTFDKWSESQADKYYEFLLESCQHVANNPKLGKKYDEVLLLLCGFNVKSHVIFYRIVNVEQIEINRIIH